MTEAIKKTKKTAEDKPKEKKPPHRFSKDNQPKDRSNAGRKYSRCRQILNQLEEKSISLSMEEFKKICAHLLTATPEELKSIAKDPKNPIVIMVIASSIIGDIESKNINNLEKLLDRVYGKVAQQLDLTNKGDKFAGIDDGL